MNRDCRPYGAAGRTHDRHALLVFALIGWRLRYGVPAPNLSPSLCVKSRDSAAESAAFILGPVLHDCAFFVGRHSNINASFVVDGGARCNSILMGIYFNFPFEGARLCIQSVKLPTKVSEEESPVTICGAAA